MALLLDPGSAPPQLASPTPRLWQVTPRISNFWTLFGEGRWSPSLGALPRTPVAGPAPFLPHSQRANISPLHVLVPAAERSSELPQAPAHPALPVHSSDGPVSSLHLSLARLAFGAPWGGHTARWDPARGSVRPRRRPSPRAPGPPPGSVGTAGSAGTVVGGTCRPVAAPLPCSRSTPFPCSV